MIRFHGNQVKSHKSDTGFWLFALKDTPCAHFIKIGDYRFPPPLVPYRELILRRNKKIPRKTRQSMLQIDA